MNDKKMKKPARKKNVPFLLKFLLFIVKIPYYIVNGIYLTILKMGEKSEENKTIKKRDSMIAKYEDFQILNTSSGDFKKFETKIIESDSKIGIIIGARGSGKTAFGIKFMENIHAKTKKNCYALGFNKEDMPSWIDVVEDITQIKNNSFVLIDEGGVLFSARDAMTKANKMLSDLILISRHKSLSILFISQNSSNLDIDILRQADYLVFKQSSLLQLDFERKKIKEIYKEIEKEFEKYKDTKGATYVYSDLFRGFIINLLPSFWNVNISKSFK